MTPVLPVVWRSEDGGLVVRLGFLDPPADTDPDPDEDDQ